MDEELERERANTTELLIPETEEHKPRKATLAQLFRYTSWSDRLLMIIGAIVAITTGVTTPLMAGVVGDLSQTFMNFTSRLAPLNDTDPEREKIFEEFHSKVEHSCLLYLCLAGVAFVTASIQDSCFMLSGENNVNRLRKAFMRAILRQNIGWFDSQKSGGLATELFSNLSRVKEGTGNHIGYIFEYFTEFLGSFAICFYYDWRLTLIGMVLTPLIVLLGVFDTKKITAVESEIEQLDAESGAMAEQALSSIRTVMAFSGQEYECKRYNNEMEKMRVICTRYGYLNGILSGTSFILIFGSYCISLWVGTNFVISGTMQGGVVITVFITLMLSIGHIDMVSPMLAQLGKAQGAAGILFEIIDREPEIDAYSPEGERPYHIDGRVSFRDLQFFYPTRPDVPVLQGVSFEVEPGQTVALVGASGSGKSTIVQLLLRFYDPTAGKIIIDGIEVDRWNINHLRKTIGVVSQEPILFDTTIEENIRYGRENISESDIWKVLKKANAHDFVKGFPMGLKTLVGARGAQLSGGQKQRIAIARALVRDPKILLLDEATSALDAESETVVQQALENASKGRTTIVVAHRLSTIRNADRIIAMKHGEIVEEGTHEELLAKEGLYYGLVNAQVFVDYDEELPKTVRHSRSISSEGTRHEFSRMHSNLSTIMDELADDDEDETMKRLKEEMAFEGAARASLWQIVKAARPEWKMLAVALFASLLEGWVYPILSMLFTKLIDVFSYEDKQRIQREGHLIALGFLGLGFVYGATQFSQRALYGRAVESMTKRLRGKLYRNVMRQDGSYFDKPAHAPGKIVTRLATDASNIEAALNGRMGGIISEICTDLLAITVAFFSGWQLALVVIPLFPIAGVIHTLRSNYLEKRWQKDVKYMETCGHIATEAMENIRTVQSLTLQDKLYKKFCAHLEVPMKTNRQNALLQGLTYGFGCSIHFFLYAVSFRVGLYYIYHRIMDPQAVLRTLFVISFTSGSIGAIASFMPEYMIAKMAAGLLFKMLEIEPMIDGMTEDGKRPQIEGHISAKGLRFAYPEREDVTVMDGLDLEIKPGQTVALVGPSGCGKSTMVALLERFYNPLEGEIVMDGCSLQEMNPTHLRSQVALVSQEPILFDMSIRENIVYGLPEGTVTDEEMFEAAKKANIHPFIASLPSGYQTRVGDKGTQLSGGQKQRIAIARALVRKPKILILDEATSALDTESEKHVQLALDQAKAGRSCLVIAHRLSTIVNSDLIVVFKEGKVVERGTHEELIAMKGVYYSLTQKQSLR